MTSIHKDHSRLPEPTGEAAENRSIIAHAEAESPDHTPAAPSGAASLPTEQPKSTLGHRPTLGALINWYAAKLQRVKPQRQGIDRHLISLTGQPIAKKIADELTANVLVRHAEARRLTGLSPATIALDLSLIRTVLEAAKSHGILTFKRAMIDEARMRCKKLGLIASSVKQKRRPTVQELKALDDSFGSRDAHGEIPMRDVMWFAIHSSRRQSEICRLEWQDNDPENHTSLLRDALHPHDPKGTHKRFKLTDEAWTLLNRQPRTSTYIFPYKPKSIGTAFARACALLGIADLTFDDLRYEATVRLFARGLQLSEVRQYTLHETPDTLQRCRSAAELAGGQLPRPPACSHEVQPPSRSHSQR